MPKNLSRVLLCLLALLPASAGATPAKFEVSGWIPYWRSATGTADVLSHLSAFTEISPFGYTVKSDGTLFDAAHIEQAPWPAFIAAATSSKVRVIPTVMWAKAEAIQAALSSRARRRAHVAAIVGIVEGHNFDGVDIDYEGKFARTRPYFSAFLRELHKALGKKWLICSIEPRTPAHSRFEVVPKQLDFANDYGVIAKYCDRVRIMAYDQGSIDIKLNATGAGPYVPVADNAWVTKVIKLAALTIPRRKIVLGVPTYGYEWQVTPLGETGYSYRLRWAFNPRYALDLAHSLGIAPTRNRAGELSFLYYPTSTPAAPAHILVWSDAIAIATKVALARSLGLRGVSIFKLDGGEDQGLWNIIGVTQTSR